MVNLGEATQKAKEYLSKAGIPEIVLRLHEAKQDTTGRRWLVVFEDLFRPQELICVEIDGESTEVTAVRRERVSGR